MTKLFTDGKLCYVAVFVYLSSFFPGSSRSQSAPFFLNSDSTTVAEDSLLRNEPDENAEAIYDNLQERADRAWWSRELLALLLESKPDNLLEVKSSAAQFIPYSGKPIRKVTVQRLDVFGPSFDAMEDKPDSWLEKTGNRLHSLSRTETITNHIIIHAGDNVDPQLLAENELVLRRLTFIEDARLLLVPVDSDTSAVDLMVITKDTWSVGAKLDVKGVDYVRTTIYDKNLLGSGNDLNSKFIYDLNESRLREQRYNYLFRNISGSFVDAHLSYKRTEETEVSGIKIERPFITRFLDLAGGTEFRSTRIFPRNQGVSCLDKGYHFHTTDVWLGRSFSLPRQLWKFDNINIAARLISTRYQSRAEVDPSLNRLLHNSTLYLASFMFTNRALYRGSLVFSLGRTEDIPDGTLANFTGGIENGEFFDRLYFGVDIARGMYTPTTGYLFYRGRAGGFLNNDEIEQGILNGQVHWFSKLVRLKYAYLRHFMSLDYTEGFNRFCDESVALLEEVGIRALKPEGLYRGTVRLAANYTSVFFPPWYLLGFRFAPFLFADLALIGDKREHIFSQPFRSGIGLGMRMRNERFVFKTLHFRLAYFPGAADDIQSFRSDITGENLDELESFQGYAPQILDFR